MIATVRPFELPLVSPLGTARGAIESRAGFLFDIFDDPKGLGEATPIAPFTEDRSECHEALRQAADAYTDTGWVDAFRSVSGTEDGRLRVPAARHAVSLARLDWLARSRYVPLYRLLGGMEGDGTVAVNATIGDHPADETAEQAATAAAAGYSAIKIKVGNRSVETDIDRVAAVRDEIGSDIDIRLDVNGAWDAETAQTFIDRTHDISLDYIEQPLDPDEFAGHGQLRNQGVDIALDESVAMYPIEDLLGAGAGDVFVVKPMAVGGVDVARGMAVALRRLDHRVIFSTTIDSVVARTGTIHLAASLPDVPASGLATGNFLESDLAPDPASLSEGTISLPDAPGLGIEEVDI